MRILFELKITFEFCSEKRTACTGTEITTGPTGTRRSTPWKKTDADINAIRSTIAYSRSSDPMRTHLSASTT